MNEILEFQIEIGHNSGMYFSAKQEMFMLRQM